MDRRGFFGSIAAGLVAPFIQTQDCFAYSKFVGFPEKAVMLEALAAPLRHGIDADTFKHMEALASIGKRSLVDSFYNIPKLEIEAKVEYPLDFSSHQITTKDVEDMERRAAGHDLARRL